MFRRKKKKLVFILFSGIGSSGATVGSLRMVDQMKQEVLSTGVVLAAFIGPPLGGLLYHFSPSLPFYFLALCCLLLAPLFLCFGESDEYGEHIPLHSSNLKLLETTRGAKCWKNVLL